MDGGGQQKLAFVVREKRKNIEILHLTDSGIFRVRDIPKTEGRNLRPVDYGAREARKMKASIRRIARKKGTPKNARDAARAVLS